MILAAGRGERLRPLTDRMPKALIEAGGKPLLAWHLERIRRAGIREVVINVSHLAGLITQRFGDGAEYGLALRWSHEPQALETAGGIAQACAAARRRAVPARQFGYLVRLRSVGLAWLDLGSQLAHLVLIPNPPHNVAGDFSLDGARIGNDAGARYTYSGIAVLSPALVSGIAPGKKHRSDRCCDRRQGAAP
jgi:MurNAc alpha-1-phosphate uridylyltransferase